jgi:N utilization substance protein A
MAKHNENAEFFEALRLLEKEKGIDGNYLLEKIKAAIVIAVKRDFGVEDENVVVRMDPATNEFRVMLRKAVVEQVENLLLRERIFIL